MAVLEVLLLEDRPGGRRALAGRLRSRGFRVRLADSETPPDALRAASPDVVLWAPGKWGPGGADTLRRIRASAPRCPLLVLASEASVAMTREAIRLGADHVLAPKARTTEVELAIHQALERASLDGGQRAKGPDVELDAQLRVIVDAAPIPLLVSRASDGEILYANDREGELLGLPRDELVGKRAADFYGDPADRRRLLDRLQREGRLEDVEVCFRRANGELAWAIFALVLTELHGEPVIVSGCYDVTRRKLTEDATGRS